MSTHKGWIGVDLDGTLAEYHGWRGVEHIGAPVTTMVDRVKVWLAEGKDVRIFTARVGAHVTNPIERERIEGIIRAWCLQHLGQVLVITATKDLAMFELWDDRAVQVVANTGLRADAGATGTEARVIAEIVQRQQVGIRKYGQTVSENPLHLREWLTHAKEEALDLAVYLTRSIEEIDAKS